MSRRSTTRSLTMARASRTTKRDFLPRTFRSMTMTCSTLTIYRLKVMRTICHTMTKR